jgi:hypothetical protein
MLYLRVNLKGSPQRCMRTFGRRVKPRPTRSKRHREFTNTQNISQGFRGRKSLRTVALVVRLWRRISRVAEKCHRTSITVAVVLECRNRSQFAPSRCARVVMSVGLRKKLVEVLRLYLQTMRPYLI